jgi:glycosyltransferase involved in cell wall biosynthesis
MLNTIAAVIPLYNKEPYIGRAIASVLAQTRSVEEIIVVDDASTDGSLEQVKTFADPRIKIVRRTDPQQRGLPATRNVGILSATSRWIALLDADDRWHDYFIEESEKLMAQASEGTGFLFTGWESISPDGVVTRDAYSLRAEGQLYRRLDLDNFVSEWLELGACPVYPSGVVIRRDILLKAGLFREHCRRGEDKDMWVRLLTTTDALSSSRVCSSYYRDIPGAMNETISTNVRHCLCATLEAMMAHSSGQRRRLLMRLFNHQVVEYARWVAGRERLSPEVYRGFFASISPQAYLFLLVLRYLPVRMQRVARQSMLRVRNVIRRE